MAAGADWVTISVDGIDDVYESIRRPLRFSEILQTLKNIKIIKKEMGFKKPIVKVQGVWPAIRPNPQEYYNLMAPYADLIAYNPLIDYLRKDTEIVYEKDFICPQLYQRVVIGSDGNAILCANDEDGEVITGNASKQSIYQIWHGDVMSHARELHTMADGFLQMNICRRCYYPRKAVPTETARINGRIISIENYLNRPQEIGK